MDDETSNPGLEVKAARTRRGWTQQQLAREIKMGRSRLSKIETGALGSLITLAEIETLERVLGVEPTVWLRRETAGSAPAEG